MNLNTHKKKLIDSIALALNEDKQGIINSFKLILSTANTLFKANLFDFWLKNIGQIPAKEIPITSFGISNAKRSLEFCSNSDINSLNNYIYSICEDIFTYSSIDDMCEMQSNFHYYFNETQSFVFKESRLGAVDPNVSFGENDIIRIAKISELNINESELYS